MAKQTSTSDSGRQIRLDDGRLLGLAEYGDLAGKPIFFCHGTPSSRLVHPDASITAEMGVRLIALDRPGCGLSDFQRNRRFLDWPDDVAEVADRLGLDRFGMVGVSGGGPYVAACAFKIPERLTAAVMVGCVGPSDVPGVMEGMPAIRRVGALLGRVAPGLLRPLLWWFQNPHRNLERFVASYTAHNLEPDRALFAQPEFMNMLKASYVESTRSGVRGFAWEVRLVSRPWGFRLQDISMDVHLWHGERDTSTPPAMARYMAEVMPNAHLTMFPHEGHLLIFTRWREILELVNGAGQ